VPERHREIEVLKDASLPAGRQAILAQEQPAERIGREIRELRKARRLTIKDLAERTRLSIGYLSEIERGLASPHVKALHDIAGALGVTIGWFFHATDAAEPGEHEIFVRSPNRRHVHFASGITDELLSPHLRGKLELLLSRFPPGASSGGDPYTHSGEEAGIVIKGSLELWVDGKRVVLEEGDSFGFESSLPHRYSNTGDSEAVVIWAITPPSY
jgi:transcriptional regulator with XRE-family HTH domain